MIVSIHQPAYLPWLGYFDRIAKSDLHIVLDHVQYEKNSFINRNRIQVGWLTIPVRQGKRPITEVEVAGPWVEKHHKTITQTYGKTPFFPEHLVEALYDVWHERLMETLRPHLDLWLEILGIDTPVVYSSEMEAEGQKAELIANLCQQVGATTYLSGPYGRDYLTKFDIPIQYHDYAHPIYQQEGKIFTSHLSVLDLVCYAGPGSLKVLTNE